MRYKVYRPVVAGEKRWGIRVVSPEGSRRSLIRDPGSGEAFRSRAEAERCIEAIRGSDVQGPAVTVEELARYMFQADSQWAERQKRRRGGRPLAVQTLREHELNVRLHIVPAIGARRIGTVDTRMVDEMLYSLELSNRTRRNVASTMTAVLKEAVRRRIIQAIPMIELPEKRSRKPSVLTMEELGQLFPTGRQGLLELWGPPGTRKEPVGACLGLSSCAAAMFFGGLRPQEARAAYPDQLIRGIARGDRGAVLLVTRSLDSSGKVLSYLKKGDDRDPRYRGTYLAERAMAIIDLWIKIRPDTPTLFSYQEKQIRIEFLRDRLALAAERAGISADRRIIPYSGRYTFNSTVRPLLPPQVLMALMGHVDQAMPEHYDVPVLTERMRQMASHFERINKAIG
jgi:integrase